MFYWTLLLSDSALSMRPAQSGLWRLARGKSTGQRDWSWRQHNKFYRKLCKQKFLFFSEDSKETCSLIFVSAIKKVYQEIIPFVKTIHIYVFIKNIIGKRNCYWHVHFLFDMYEKKQINFEHVLYPLLIKSEEKII